MLGGGTISTCACSYYSIALLGKQFPLSEIVAIRKVKVKQKCKVVMRRREIKKEKRRKDLANPRRAQREQSQLIISRAAFGTCGAKAIASKRRLFFFSRKWLAQQDSAPVPSYAYPSFPKVFMLLFDAVVAENRKILTG